MQSDDIELRRNCTVPWNKQHSFLNSKLHDKTSLCHVKEQTTVCLQLVGFLLCLVSFLFAFIFSPFHPTTLHRANHVPPHWPFLPLKLYLPASLLLLPSLPPSLPNISSQLNVTALDWSQLSKKECVKYGGSLVGKTCKYVPDLALMSFILFFGTYSMTVSLKKFKFSRYFPTKVRPVYWGVYGKCRQQCCGLVLPTDSFLEENSIECLQSALESCVACRICQITIFTNKSKGRNICFI